VDNGVPICRLSPPCNIQAFFRFAAAALAVAVLAKDEEPEKLGTVIGIDLGTFFVPNTIRKPLIKAG